MSEQDTVPQVWLSERDVPSGLAPAVVTIGNFDGVHLGHRKLLAAVCDRARSEGLQSRALTFNPHPRHVMTGGRLPELITGYADRDRLVIGAGVDALLDLTFTREFAQLSAEDFVRKYLVELLGAEVVILGRDSRFGRANEGGYADMCRFGRKLGFETATVDELLPSDCATERISSSQIRAHIRAGRMRDAGEMLGRHHFVSDTIRHGFKRGRELGFPTANFGPQPSGLVPADGVYAGYFSIVDGDRFLHRVPATISVGTNPTFEHGPPVRIVETYVHGSHDYDLYDRCALVEFVALQRPTLAFGGVGELVTQMHEDIAVTHSTLAALPAQLRGASC